MTSVSVIQGPAPGKDSAELGTEVVSNLQSRSTGSRSPFALTPTLPPTESWNLPVPYPLSKPGPPPGQNNSSASGRGGEGGWSACRSALQDQGVLPPFSVIYPGNYLGNSLPKDNLYLLCSAKFLAEAGNPRWFHVLSTVPSF